MERVSSPRSENKICEAFIFTVDPFGWRVVVKRKDKKSGRGVTTTYCASSSETCCGSAYKVVVAIIAATVGVPPVTATSIHATAWDRNCLVICPGEGSCLYVLAQ